MSVVWPYDKSKTVCISGHRQEKLPDNGKTTSMKMRQILSMLYFEIFQSIRDGYNTFIVGGSRGIDLMAAEFIYQFIHQGEDIKLVVAMPYPDFGKNYKNVDLYMRGNAIAEAELVVNVSEKYSEGSYSKRNRFMVDHSSRIIAVVADPKSGTGQTIRYAEKSGLDMKIINADKFSKAVDKALESHMEFIEEPTAIENIIRVYYKDKDNDEE